MHVTLVLLWNDRGIPIIYYTVVGKATSPEFESESKDMKILV